MAFYEKVLFQIKRKGISINKMLTDLRLGKSSMVDWKERGNIPSGEVVARIAKYFDVTTDYLLTEEEKPTTINEQPASQAIAELWDEIDDLDDEEAIKTLEHVRLLKLRRKP